MGRSSSIGLLAQVLVFIALLIATSGCGGGGSSATHSTTVKATHTLVSALPTHAVFIRRLDALCAAGNRKAAVHLKALTQAINANELKKAGDILASTEPEAAAFYLRVERLTPSAEDREAFVHYLVLTHRLFGLDERLVAVLHASNVGEFTRLSGLAQKVHNHRTIAAFDLGSRKCGT